MPKLVDQTLPHAQATPKSLVARFLSLRCTDLVLRGNQVLIAHLPSLSGQVNRIRCGQLGRQPVVAAVDAAGGVLVAPSLVNAKLPPIKLLNPGVGEQASGMRFHRSCEVALGLLLRDPTPTVHQHGLTYLHHILKMS